ncbi:MAG: nucleotide exchange factor GrpE [Candidatus Electryoneaceae bacterium]|nr:nucleotide exchange factor GrpE [Candidatus Electryoneaceae bacterium]
MEIDKTPESLQFPTDEPDPNPPVAEDSEVIPETITESVEERIAALQDQLSGQMDDLLRQFQSKIKYDAHKEEIINKLHSELQDYKTDLLQKLLRPLIMDIIHLMDDLTKLIDHYRSQDPSQTDPTKFIRLMAEIPSDLEDILYRQEVESFRHSEKDKSFDPSRQRALKTRKTGDQSLDKTIAQSLRVGFEWMGKVLRPEMVEAFVYDPNLADHDDQSIDNINDNIQGE